MDFRIGIIGATGYVGTPYRQEIRDFGTGARIVALCARRRDRLAEAARQDGADLATDRWQEVVEHPDVNLVLVLTPDTLHYEPVMMAARLGKHIFCEKPVACSAADANAMWMAVQQAGVRHFVPFWTRYVPVFRRAKYWIGQGRLGEIRSFVYRWHNPRPVNMPFTWRDDATKSSGGSVADVGSHAYDTLRFLLGDKARRVLGQASVLSPAKPDLGEPNLAEALAWGESAEATVAARRSPTVPDYAVIQLEMTGGSVGTILLSHTSYVRKGFAPELEIHGTDASMSVDRLTGELRIADSPQPARRWEQIDDLPQRNRFAEHVFPALASGRTGIGSEHPGLDDGWRVQCFIDAALESSRKGTWVPVTE